MPDINLLREIEELRRRLDAVENLSVSPPLRLIDAFGAKSLEIDDPSHWARITGISGTKYSHAEVVPNPSSVGSWSLLAAGITGTFTDSPAWETNLSTTVPVDGSFVTWIRPHPNGFGWVFEATGGTSSTPTVGPIYARLTGRSGGKYSFVQVTRNSSGTYVDVSGGITGNTSTTYAQDIGGIANDILFTPANQVFLLIPNASVSGTWLFGPVVLC